MNETLEGAQMEILCLCIKYEWQLNVCARNSTNVRNRCTSGMKKLVIQECKEQHSFARSLVTSIP